jgi:hypothetical protein
MALRAGFCAARSIAGPKSPANALPIRLVDTRYQKISFNANWNCLGFSARLDWMIRPKSPD